MGKKKSNASDSRFEMTMKTHSKSLRKALETGILDRQAEKLSFFLEVTGKCFISSSCSGGIVLLQQFSEKKGDSFFCRKWHRAASFDEAWSAIAACKKGELWFKQEPFILHLCVKDKKNALKLLEAKYNAGIRRERIISAKDGLWVIELLGSHGIAFPVKNGSEVLIGKKGFKEILETANRKLGLNFTALERLERELEKVF